jgi:ribosomal protein S8E
MGAIGKGAIVTRSQRLALIGRGACCRNCTQIEIVRNRYACVLKRGEKEPFVNAGDLCLKHQFEQGAVA